MDVREFVIVPCGVLLLQVLVFLPFALALQWTRRIRKELMTNLLLAFTKRLPLLPNQLGGFLDGNVLEIAAREAIDGELQVSLQWPLHGPFVFDRWPLLRLKLVVLELVTKSTACFVGGFDLFDRVRFDVLLVRRQLLLAGRVS